MARTLNDQCLALYKAVVDEEHYFLDGHHARLKFFVGLVTAIMGAVIYGMYHADNCAMRLVLLAGPIFGVAVSIFGIDATFRFYQRFLETVTVRAKLEDELGLTRRDSKPRKHCWPNEPLVFARHLEKRAQYGSSANFLEDQKKLGSQRSTRRIFFAAIALFGFVFLICLVMLCLECSVCIPCK